MKKQLAIFVLVLFASCAYGIDIDLGDRALYWCNQNGHTNITSLVQCFNYKADGSRGALSEIAWSAESWKVTTPPTIATLNALDTATVEAWKADLSKSREADPEQMTPQLKAVVKFFAKWINDVVPADKRKTADQIKAGIKAEM